MGTITPYESAKGRRYRVRYRKPDRTEAEKRGFTTMREAKPVSYTHLTLPTIYSV